jgi:succinate-semialdehyde dehydrogenase/glutarate-semialdehyde dehydrogenase
MPPRTRGLRKDPTVTAAPDVAANLIDGSRLPGSGGETIDVLDPATGEVVGRIPAGSPADADAAVTAAAKAHQSWARTAPADRADLLKQAARTLRSHVDELAGLQTRENGKPLGDSRGGVLAGIGAIEQYAELGPLHRGRSLQGRWDATDVMVHEPYGVAAVLTPWNDPVAIACGLLAATLVVGNTVVFKPSEKTPLSAVRLAELLDLPAGVLNVVLGDGRAGRALVQHDDVDLVLHVGSMATGREIGAECGRRLRRCVLELGGKDALIVDEGVDPVWAAQQAASGAFANAGQICTSVERIYVHAAVADAFVTALVDAAEALVSGPGTSEGTTLGPLVDEAQRTVVHDHVTQALAAGAVARTGGAVPAGPGFFYPATVLVDVTDDMAVMREETFGPVAAVRVVASFDEALSAAAAGDYGLAATVLTPSPANAQRAARELAVGTVKVNAVWGGAPGGAAHPHRGSGLGFGYGPELLDEVTQTKVLHLGVPPG